jgi:hypothetical protein
LALTEKTVKNSLFTGLLVALIALASGCTKVRSNSESADSAYLFKAKPRATISIYFSDYEKEQYLKAKGDKETADELRAMHSDTIEIEPQGIAVTGHGQKTTAVLSVSLKDRYGKFQLPFETVADAMKLKELMQTGNVSISCTDLTEIYSYSVTCERFTISISSL